MPSSCSRCHGSGEVHRNPSPIGDPQCAEDYPCDRCDGTGTTDDGVALEVRGWHGVDHDPEFFLSREWGAYAVRNRADPTRTVVGRQNTRAQAAAMAHRLDQRVCVVCGAWVRPVRLANRVQHGDLEALVCCQEHMNVWFDSMEEMAA